MKTPRFLSLARAAAELAADKKAYDISLLNVGKYSSVADYFLIATADSPPQLHAILDSMTKTFKEKEAIAPVHSEGKHHSDWVVLDYGGLVIHLMLPKARDFYALDKIWGDARKIK